MRGNRILHAALAVLLAAVVLKPATALSQDQILRLSNTTLPPVTTDAGDGYLNRILDEMFARAGLGYELERTPPARGLADANAGLIDGEAARAGVVSGEFDRLIKLPEPVFHAVFAGLYLNPDLEAATWDDLASYRIGYVRGWKIFEKLFQNHGDSVVVNDAETLLNMLVKDRIDFALLTIVPARHVAASLGMPKPLATKPRIRTDMFMYLNEKHADKVDILNSALVSMKAGGSYDAIMRDYFTEEE